LKLNPAYPIIRELHLIDRPWYFESIKMPYTDSLLRIPLPKWPAMTLHLIYDRSINAEILKTHRFGHFDGSITLDEMLNFVRLIFPETKFSKEDTLMTCGPEFTKVARTRIIQALKNCQIDKIIHDEAERLISRWKHYQESGVSFDLTTETRLFTSSVITTALLGGSNECVEIAESVFFINQYLYAKAVRQLKKGDEGKFSLLCNSFKRIINQIIDGSELNPLPLLHGLTRAQQQAMCLILFFAGQETTSFALDHILAKLAIYPKEQETLFNAIQVYRDSSQKQSDYLQLPIMRSLIDQCLLEIPPVLGVARRLRYNTKLIFKTLDNQCIVKAMRQGEDIDPLVMAGAEQLLKKYPASGMGGKFIHEQASIFGNGTHSCIGQQLAYKELAKLIAEISINFKLSTTETKLRCIPKITMQAQPFFIKAHAHS
jgi:hypothetical protein